MRCLSFCGGGFFYLCAVVMFVFTLIATLKTSGLFLSETFATWLASALIALTLGLGCLGAPLLDAQLKTRRGKAV